MTWLSTWPADGGYCPGAPQYREHGSESAAEEYARGVGGVAFWSSDETMGDVA